MSEFEFNTIMAVLFGLTMIALVMIVFMDRGRPAPANPIQFDDEAHGDWPHIGGNDAR